jgi:glycosyltransferase involved in cell wall biosynthesis
VLPARSQLLRMGVAVPRLLRRVRPALVHFLHALPLGLPCPGVVMVPDVSFEIDPPLMPRVDRAIFRAAVPRSVRAAARVVTCSERTRSDLVRSYGVPFERIAVIPHGVAPEFTPGPVRGERAYALVVGAVELRKDPLAAVRAAARAGLPVVVAGPVRDSGLAGELVRRGARLDGYVGRPELVELYRGAACLVFPSRFEGFGLPILEAMACGTPVVATDDPAVQEVAGDAAILVPRARLAEGRGRALADREKLVTAGLERAAGFRWDDAARRTVAVWRQALGVPP